LGFGIETLNSLGENVSRGVTKNVEAVRAGELNAFDDVTGVGLVGEIAQFAVDTHRDNRAVAEQLEPGVRNGERQALGHNGLLLVTLCPSLAKE
jgi:hypothetical protein